MKPEPRDVVKWCDSASISACLWCSEIFIESGSSLMALSGGKEVLRTFSFSYSVQGCDDAGDGSAMFCAVLGSRWKNWSENYPNKAGGKKAFARQYWG